MRRRSSFLLVAAAVCACADIPTVPSGSDPTSPAAPTPPAPPPAPSPESPEVTPIALRVSPDAGAIDPGEAIQLQAVLIAEDLSESDADEVTWVSSDPDVASVAPDGSVMGVGGGIAYITGRQGALRDSARVVVRFYLSSISVGGMHTCGVDPFGAAYCWGKNSHGELGTGDYVDREMPARAAKSMQVSSVSAAGGFTCGVSAAGAGYCWGDDSMMELGETQAGKTSAVPMAIEAPLVLQKTSGSQMAHACGLETSGKAWCWGYNRFGMVGHGILRDEPIPVPVAGELSFSDLHSTYFRTCGVEAGGDVYCWGRGGPAQIGNPAATLETCSGQDCALVPMRATSAEFFVQVSVGMMHTCALTLGGDVHCWGANDLGQLGVGGYVDRDTPTAVALPGPAMSVTVGRAHSCALMADGTAYCWGDNIHGQLGTDDWISSDAPRQVSGGLTFAFMDAGYRQTCAIDDRREAYCWGQNKQRQLGVGESDTYATPAKIQFE